MGCASQAAISMLSAANCYAVASSSSRLFFFNKEDPRVITRNQKQSLSLFRIRASSDNSDDCNVEECAPDKEVGKVSVEWLAGEKTKVVGTFPPRNRGWTGYVEKDTAGQRNIYSVEPAVYVAESALSSGTAGSSSTGSEKTAAVAAGIALISIAAASLILLQVGKNPPEMQTGEYYGPSLSYYINKFKPPEMVQASVPPQTETSVSLQPESNPTEVPGVEAGPGYQPTASSELS